MIGLISIITSIRLVIRRVRPNKVEELEAPDIRVHPS
jgi:hypothetical protein